MYKLTLILRYLLKRRITHVAILAVALCVFIVVVVMTVMAGLVGDFKEKNHAFVGDCVVGTKSLVGFPYYEDFVDALEQTDFVQAASSVVKNYGLLRAGDDDQPRGVEIVGLDPARHAQATNFGSTLYHRRDAPTRAFVPMYDPNAIGCVLGIDMALLRNPDGRYHYSAYPVRVGMTVTGVPLTARGAPAKAGTDLVNTLRLFYSDHSETGIAGVDISTVYIPLEQAQLLCMSGQLKRVSAIHIRFRPGTRLDDGVARVSEMWDRFRQDHEGQQDASLLDGVIVEDWKVHRKAMIAPMEKEESLMGVLFSFVGLTTVFIVFVVFYMVISHKTKDIGILKSVGASNVSIMVLFCGFAFAVGLIGSALGTAAGCLFLAKINPLEDWLFERYGLQLWDRTMYAIGDIPNRIEPGMLVVIVCCAIVACLIGAFVPACNAARLRPVEVLHTGEV
jgi:lipoprotein-releasing system permease protein